MLNKLPSPFWAVVLAFMGVVITLCVLFANKDGALSHDVLAIAASLISGALGAFAAHAQQASKADVTTGSAPVTINQTKDS